MSDENINPQNIPIQPSDANLTEQQPPSLNSKKIIFIILLAILIIGIPISFFFFSKLDRLSKPPAIIPTDIPKTTDIPSPTQEAGEYIITIKLEETIIIPNTTISLTYKNADIPGENCFDCIATNVIEAKMKEQISILDYSCGGFSGECIVMQRAYGYEIEIAGQMTKDILKLKIKKVE